jgi:tetratricopeptide (TPR) repeat protein
MSCLLLELWLRINDGLRDMRKAILIVMLFVLLAPAAILAKPLLTDSQDTFVSVCIDYGDTPERLVEICQNGLKMSGASVSQRVEMMDSLAWAHYDLDDIDQATAVFEDILTLDPQAQTALDGLGWMAFENDAYNQAVEYFGRAMEIGPDARVVAGLGVSLLYSDQADLQKALSYLDAAIAIDPDYSWAKREKAWILEDHGQPEEAIRLFREVSKQHPDDAYSAYGLAYVLSELDRWEDALPHANRALEINPDYLSARSRRSLILLNLDRPKMALKDGQVVLDARPNTSDGYVRVARAMWDLGRLEDGIVLLASAVDRIGYEAYLSYWYARLLFADDQNVQALAVIDDVMVRGDGDFHDYRLYSRITLDLGELDKARDRLDQGLEAFPEDDWLLYYNALLMVKEHLFETAEQEFDAAVKAGLPRTRLKTFLSSLVGEGQFMQAIEMRVRYSDQDG